ncbi:hypothetical protein C2845_PM08G27830 [Panicum miliaceum]|uniref:Uncharacterized protein n=1 Tax=Panicum miliaceum TaxID=4540 RepID=A0A3L6QX98_PANMI|nr:hypothetical protein C2845_PM08G27830 [Panicum miliaceum]
MAALVLIWLCFFLVHLLGGGKPARVPRLCLLQGVFETKPCGVAYWLIMVVRIPIVVAFTACVVHWKRKSQAQASLELDETALATTMFMILFSSSMPTVQLVILGVDGVVSSLVYATICFVAAIVGLVAVEGAIPRSGRVSLIVLAVAAAMALSAAVDTSSGRPYTGGEYMGFKLPC